MPRLFIACLLATSLIVTPALRADVSLETPSAEMSTDPTATDVAPEEDGTPVGQAAGDGVNAAKKRQWQNIALAVGAVAVAVTALILVSANEGHHQHHHSHEHH